MKTLASLFMLLISCGVLAQPGVAPENILSEYMQAKSDNNYERIKIYFSGTTEKDFEYFSKPENYIILKKYEIGKELKIVQGFERGDIVLKVQEINPDEVIFYTFRRLGEQWRLVSFEIEAAFWHNSF